MTNSNLENLEPADAQSSSANAQLGPGGFLLGGIGKPGELIADAYRNEERRVDTLTVEDYRRMKDNDGQVQMLLNATYNTILAAGFTIQDDPDWDQKEPSEEQQFVEENLTQPRWKNGMSRNLLLTNKTNLRALEEGYRVSEIIYRNDEDGKVRLDQLAPRAIRDSDFQLKLLVDDSGQFSGFRQRITFKNIYYDVAVLNDSELLKTINIVYGEEYGSNYGRPALKPVFYHYDKAHKGMYINHVGHELGAVKYRQAKIKQGANLTDSDKTQLDEILERVGFVNYARLAEDKVEIIFEDVADAGVMDVGRQMIAYHTSQMAKALLAQFIDLGSNTSTTGSRSLGAEQISFFKTGLQFVATLLIENPWNRIIADLMKINFDRGIYPQYKVNPIQDETVEALLEIYKEMIRTGKITKSIQTEVLEQGSQKLGLEIRAETLEAELAAEEQKQQQAEEMKFKQNMELNKMRLENMGRAELADIRLQDTDERQDLELTPDARKVKFGDIASRLDDAELRASLALERKIRGQRDEIVRDYIIAARKGPKSLRKIKINLQEEEFEQDTYSEELMLLALQMIELGKILAANELNKAVPTTRAKQRAAIEAEIRSILEKQQSDLQFRLEQVALNAINNNIPETETELLLQQEFTSFFDSVIQPTLLAVVPKMFNRGRQITFDAYEGDGPDDIWGYRSVSVLDNRTTEYCRALHNKVFERNDPMLSMTTPPSHYGCRRILVPITNQEAEDLRIIATGAPPELPVFASFNSFRDVDDVQDLSREETEIIALIDQI